MIHENGYSDVSVPYVSDRESVDSGVSRFVLRTLDLSFFWKLNLVSLLHTLLCNFRFFKDTFISTH